MKRLGVFAVGVMMDSLFGIIFAVMGAAYVMARMELPPFEWFTAADIFWLLGATVVVSAVLNLPREVRRWTEPE
jgi:hypothetical protein